MNDESALVKELPAQLDWDDVLMEYKYLQSLCLVTRGVSHDYNNIFTGLSGQLGLIGQEATLGGIAENRVQMVNDLLARGVKRTSILYEFSRYSHTEKLNHSLDRILDMAIESLNILSRSHQFVVEKNGELPRLRCRLKDMVMMLFYLGENGLEATPDGGTIKVSAELDRNLDQAVIFSVWNRGKGISPTVRDSLFKPFVSTKKSEQGLRGLGLYAAQNIVREHGGNLVFSDDTEDGTVFSARIPLFEQGAEKVVLEKKIATARQHQGKECVGQKT